ncbi:hypothetical protein JW859_05835, partial [bacterium]|nr:hypothetical protein [bacterium]
MGTALLNRDRYGQGKAIPKDASGAGTNWGNGIQSDDPFANVRRQGCLRHKKLENYSTPARRGLQDVH